MIVNDDALRRAGLPSCSLANIDVTDIQVVISPLGTYIRHGLVLM